METRACGFHRAKGARLPALRLRTFYFAISTLGFATIVTQIALAWQKVSGKPGAGAPRAETPEGQPAEMGLGVHVPFGPMLAIAGSLAAPSPHIRRSRARYAVCCSRSRDAAASRNAERRSRSSRG